MLSWFRDQSAHGPQPQPQSQPAQTPTEPRFPLDLIIDRVSCEVMQPQSLINADPTATMAVLFTTGSMCPVHRHHVEAMVAAAHRLRGFAGPHTVGIATVPTIVVGGLMSVTHDEYVTDKMRRKRMTSISGADRLTMLRLTLAQNDEACRLGIMASEFEIAMAGFVDYPEVTAALKRQLVERLRSSPLAEVRAVAHRVLVYYVCGEDHAHSCQIYEAPTWADGLIVVGRSHDTTGHGAIVETPHLLVQSTLPAGADGDISSTKIREHMINDGMLTLEHAGSLAASAYAYILHRGIRVSRIG
jgi:hypothetical protein